MKTKAAFDRPLDLVLSPLKHGAIDRRDQLTFTHFTQLAAFFTRWTGGVLLGEFGKVCTTGERAIVKSGVQPT
jgi:hypothetical protein